MLQLNIMSCQLVCKGKKKKLFLDAHPLILRFLIRAVLFLEEEGLTVQKQRAARTGLVFGVW